MVETIGEAFSLGRRVTVRCASGKRDAMKSIREYVMSAELDLRTLVWTRGASFPLSDLPSRLKCPRCGSRRVTLLYLVPKEPASSAARGAQTFPS
jgi:hypothetical protein